MKIALVTDTHFGARGDSPIFNEFFYKFWEGTFFPHLEKNQIKHVIHLGDVMDRRKFVSYKIAKDFRERFLDSLNKLDCQVHMIAGNHDVFYKNTNEVNSLKELVSGRYQNFFVYDECQEIEIDGTSIFLIPWINNENYTDTVNKMKSTKAQIAMGHLEINGFEMYAGHVASSGYDKNLFSRFDLVFSGHFHKKSDDGQIYYLGSTYPITWGDYECPRGFHVFDTETRELEYIVNPHTIFKKIYYDDTSSNYTDFDFASVSDKFVKVIVVNKKDYYGFDLFIDNLLKTSAHEVKIVENFTDVDAENVSDEVAEKSEDTISLLNNYVDELEISLDKSKLSAIMKSLYLEANELEL